MKNYTISGEQTRVLIQEGLLEWQALTGLTMTHPEFGSGIIKEIKTRSKLHPLISFITEGEGIKLSPEALDANGTVVSFGPNATQTLYPWISRQQEFRDFCEQRKIEKLIHFTLQKNIIGILERGLLPRTRLDANNIVVTDPDRFDGQLDYISVSIGFPNYRTFYRKQNDEELTRKGGGWAVVSIDPSALSRLGCLFIPMNAASTEGQAIARANPSSLASLKELFADADSRVGLPAGYPTNPQAEVLFRRHLPSCYFREVIVKDEKTKKTIQAQVQNFPVRVNAELFKPRRDWEHWTTPRL